MMKGNHEKLLNLLYLMNHIMRMFGMHVLMPMHYGLWIVVSNKSGGTVNNVNLSYYGCDLQ